MSRRNAALAGLVAWLVALLAAPEKTVRGVAIWAAVSGAVIAIAIVVSRSLAKALRDTVMRGRS